ncbi:MAG: O-antigen ligase family protein [Polyangiaceae bacterium]
MTGDAKGALIVALILASIAAVINDTLVVLLMTPLVLGLSIFAMSRIPARLSMQGLMFVALTFPNPTESFPWGKQWTAPFQLWGCVMLAHINTVDRSIGALSWCSFSGMDIMLAALGLIVYRRRSSGSKIDAGFPSPPPLNRLARISLLTTLFVWLSGMVRGGDFRMSLWQINTVVYLPVLYLLFQAALRGPKDTAGLLKVLLAAACYRALIATFVMHSFIGPPDEFGSTKLPFATSHADSMLFADAFVAVVVIWVERAAKQVKWRLAALLPIIMLGMVSNNRRLVWVHLLISLAVLYLVTDPSKLKRRIQRSVLLASPVALGYVIAGWGSLYGNLFKPVRTLRTIVDAKADTTGSTFWRELENFDLVSTLRENPIFGTGYGHPYIEAIKLPNIDYDLERYCPHNSILGLWAYGGLLGFAGVTMLWVGGIYFASRSYRRASDPTTRAAALMSMIGVLVYVMHSWGDLGLGTWTGAFTAAASLAVAAKLARPSGAWGTPAAASAAGPLPRAHGVARPA